MKKLNLLLVLFIALFSVFYANDGYALQAQEDTTSASADIGDLEFTTIGSKEDSVANNIKPDSVDKKIDSVKVDVKTAQTGEKSLWIIFVIGFFGGFAAFIMPCIYPMVPLTVSFFTKRAETKGKGIQGAILYGLSIITIYVLIGVIITLIWGASAMNQLSTSGVFNVAIFLILLIFGISFLGAFEITLPSRFVNKLDAKSDSKGLMGIFFMAATLTVVSFSCTGPIIGSVLVSIDKGLLAPVVAMFGFSLSLALIFTVFAIFPGWMTSLPKSGGWLNAVKVVLGILEIGFAMKFLSTADLAYHWGILDREVFLAIWIVLAFILGFYLLGKIKFSHDSDLPYVSIPRLFLAVVSFAFAVYLIPGLWGAPLKAVSGLVPPLSTQDFVIGEGSGTGTASHADTTGKKKKYADFLHIPHGIDGYFDYEEALAYAKEVNKPLFLDFTGHGCVNCREMEARVWSDKQVLKRLKEDYIVVSLYTDDKTALPENEQFYSKILKTQVNTVGKKFQHLQAERFGTVAQPYYVLLDTNEKELVSPPIGVEFKIDAYLGYLDKGLSEFANKK
ncbi:cytochrome c biogenesis protein CcdA [Pedobacter sp.]|uniref:protein-disulfide reductase DsbD family protein n=1 Tax=Pedobacter sp. TaxID=1411316 RepID=UPI0031D0B0AC